MGDTEKGVQDDQMQLGPGRRWGKYLHYKVFGIGAKVRLVIGAFSGGNVVNLVGFAGTLSVFSRLTANFPLHCLWESQHPYCCE